MKPHKWAKEIKAWADGAEIEYYDSSVNDWRDKTFPDWFENYRFRIKPQPKEPQYLYVYEDSFYGVGEKNSRASTRIMNKRVKEFEANYIGKIKLEVDDGTNLG